MNYTVEYSGFSFNVYKGDFIFCQNRETGKINYSLLIGREHEEEFRSLVGYEDKRESLPLGLQGIYALPNLEYIQSKLPENYSHIVGLIKLPTTDCREMIYPNVNESFVIIDGASLLSMISDL